MLLPRWGYFAACRKFSACSVIRVCLQELRSLDSEKSGMADAGVEQLKQSPLVYVHPNLTYLGWTTVWESKAKKSISMFGLGVGVISKRKEQRRAKP